jgi:autotransporter-associated beta strand protein
VTQVRAGTLQIGSGGASGSVGSGDVTVSSGATLSYSRNDTVSVANKITGAGSVSQNGAGTITLTASTSDFTGGTNINAGILVARVGSIGSGNVTLNSGAKQFKLSNSDFSISNNIAIASGVVGVSGQGLVDTDTNVDAVLNGNITINGTPTNGGHFGSSSGGSLTIAGTISSSVPVIFQRNNIRLTGNNIYTTATTIIAGTTLQVGAGTDAGSIASTSSITNNGSLVYNVGAGSRTLAAPISGSGSLTQNSAGGTLALTGTNTYTGTTTVSVGTLIVNGSHTGGGAYSVASGAILGGNGTIGSTLAVTGSLRPGNSIGTLNVSNDVTWNSGDNWVFELGAGNTSDLLNITGSFTKGTGSVFAFDFAGSTNLGTFKLVDWTGSTTFAATDFSYSNLGGGNTGTFAFNGSQLEFTAVPEPSTWALLAGSLTVVVTLRRRRH